MRRSCITSRTRMPSTFTLSFFALMPDFCSSSSRRLVDDLTSLSCSLLSQVCCPAGAAEADQAARPLAAALLFGAWNSQNARRKAEGGGDPYLLPEQVVLLGAQLVVPGEGAGGGVEVDQAVRPVAALLVDLGLQLVHIGVAAGQRAAAQQLLLVRQLHPIQALL